MRLIGVVYPGDGTDVRVSVVTLRFGENRLGRLVGVGKIFHQSFYLCVCCVREMLFE